MKKAKGFRKIIPRFTPLERNRAMDVKRIVERDGLNPLSIVSVDIGGISPYSYDNIAHYFEIEGVPFDLVHSNFQLTKEGAKYERRQVLT